MTGDLVLLAAFLMQPDPAAASLRVEVLHLHPHDGADAGEGVDHHPDQGAITQPLERAGVDGVEQGARLVAGEHRCLAALDHVFRAAHRVRRVHLEDVAGHQPVEQHPQRRQMLLDRRRREAALQILDEGGDVERLDVGELGQAVRLAPGGEAARRVQIGPAGVVIVDLRGEELEHALRRLRRRRPQCGRDQGRGGGQDELAHAIVTHPRLGAERLDGDVRRCRR